MGIWTPTSYWYREALVVDKAVNHYDERLHFGQNQQNGQWVIFMEQRGEQVPILGWNRIPSPDEALKRLYKSDARRHGEQILNGINQHNERIRKQLDEKAKDGEGQLAEALDWSYRQEGIHPSPRIYMPKGIGDNEPSRGREAGAPTASNG